MTDKQQIQMAKVLSMVFSPFYVPVWSLIGLFLFSHLKLFPLYYKLYVLFVVFCFTVLIPWLSIFVFQRTNRLSRWQMSHRRNLHVSYVLTLISYATCLLLMYKTHVPLLIRNIVVAALVAQVICTLVNLKWKISIHMVGMGGLTGVDFALSNLFFFNPLLPGCILIMLSGLVGTSRIILRQHTLLQVVAGFAVGFACAMLFTLSTWMV
ncbi:MAG: hypothetical protein IKG99_13095 [Bacteroidaceae bacterium]|nr:hypothetical protein [Bacteroidaceae bacterium]